MKRVAAWALVATATACLLVQAVLARSVDDFLMAVVVGGSFTAVGGFLALRRPGNAEGWLLLVVGWLWAVALLPYEPILGTLGWSPERQATAVWPTQARWVLPLGLMGTQVLLRFPSGTLPSARWRWFSRCSLGLIALFVVVFPLALPTVSVWSPAQGTFQEVPNPGHRTAAAPPVLVLFGLLAASFVASTASLVVRYRRAGEIEREQVRWIAWAAAVFVGQYLLIDIPFSFLPSSSPLAQLEGHLGAVVFALVPLATGFAVMHYRLYDIDRIISRTASYAVVTGLLLAVYAAVVTSVTHLLPSSSGLAVALATLTVAAGFRPVLGRVQRAVDRRFNRSRFDAERTLEAFGARLRDQVEPDLVVARLVDAVHLTVQPAVVGVLVIERLR